MCRPAVTMSRVLSTKVSTTPFEGQKPGTSGLRKKVTEFQKPHYTENFVQSTLSALGDKIDGCTLVVGGDGRYFTKEAVAIIIKMAAANGVSALLDRGPRLIAVEPWDEMWELCRGICGMLSVLFLETTPTVLCSVTTRFTAELCSVCSDCPLPSVEFRLRAHL